MKGTGEKTRGLGLAAAALACSLLASAAAAAGAQGAPGCTSEASQCPPLLFQIGSPGSGAGQISNPRGIATDPTNGHVFVAETGNRIEEFGVSDAFIHAWGWGVIDGKLEEQVCTTATGCANGVAGNGAGQMNTPASIEVDETGNIWVGERDSIRVQKFSPKGAFLLMIGGQVNKTKVSKRKEQEANSEPVTVTEAEENICTAASGDTCGVGVSGTGKGQFKAFQAAADSIAMDPSGTIYVGDENRILKFKEDGSYAGDIALPGAGRTRGLTIDPSGRIYLISDNVKEKISIGEPGILAYENRVVREIDATGKELKRLKGKWQERTTPKDPNAVAADVEGNVYVVGKVIYNGEPGKFKEFDEVVAFDDEANLISFEPELAGFGRPTDGGSLITVATNSAGGEPGEVIVGHLSPSYLLSYGIPFAPPPPKPPTIADQFVRSVGSSDATLEGLVNPRFAEDTTFWVEYGTGECKLGGCEETPPAPLGGGKVNSPLATRPVSLSGLEPGTTYHYRFAAENEAGGPVFATPEETFRTYPLPEPPDPSCPNAALRIGPSALLPDCRAYEMVSPVDKEGGEIFVLPDVPGFPTAVDQGSPDGQGLTYSSYRAFADPHSSPLTSQYLANRTAEGWSNEQISPPREGVIDPSLETQFRAFSDDLSRSFLVTESEPVLAAGGLPSFPNLYLRDNDAGSYLAQCATPPPGLKPSEFQLEPQGSSTDGSHLVFRANAKLTADAEETTTAIAQLYECVNGTELRLVSVLPGGEASASGGSAGTSGGGLGGFGARYSALDTAVSEDGSRIFFTAPTPPAEEGPGSLYARIDGTETQLIAPSGARFRAATPDGAKAIYSVGSELREAIVEPGAVFSAPIAGKVEGFMGASEDAMLVYLVSEEDLDGGGPGKAGANNLYLFDKAQESFAFVGALSEDDAREEPESHPTGPTLTPVANAPFKRSSRVTPDGLSAAFTSTARLTGYDNTDLASGEADAEVFVYDAEAEELRCASCNPGGARPVGENVGIEDLPFWAAAKIPGWENSLHGSRALSDDGERLFFEASDPLALGDTNGAQDVYQWEATGAGSCTESSPTHSPAAGGCISLISSGQNPEPSSFLDASASGGDVFFKTASSLWPLDPGLVDIYDARVEGGFQPPTPPLPPCEGEACQPPSSPPPLQTPASSTFIGPGDVVEKPKSKPKKKHCRKGTHKVKKKGKVRCVKNQKKKRQRGARR